MRFTFLSLAGFCLFAVQCVPVQASVIFSENFDELPQGVNVTSVGQFVTTNGTNVDVVGVGIAALCNGPESGNCIDMNGSAASNPQGQLQSTTLFGAGNYLLSFDLIGMQRGDTASVTVNMGNYSQTFTLLSNDFTTGIVTNAAVTVTAPSYLTFASNRPGLAGLLLDNVSVSTAPLAAVPEPSTSALLGCTMVAALGALRLRRRLS